MPHLSKYKLPSRARKVPRPRQPDGIRLRYAGALKPFVADMVALVRSRLKPLLAVLFDRHTERTRLDAMPPGKRVAKVMAGISDTMLRQWPNERIAAIAGDIALATSKFQKAELFKQINQALNINVASVLDRGVAARMTQFAIENTALIRTVQTRYLDQVTQVILAGMSSGVRHEELAAEIADRADVAESNALRIARDQVGKFNGQLNMVRQQQLGIEGFVWHTVKDSRVREEHVELDGKAFDWDDPPEEGIPGEPVNCRCFASPRLGDLLSEGD